MVLLVVATRPDHPVDEVVEFVHGPAEPVLGRRRTGQPDRQRGPSALPCLREGDRQHVADHPGLFVQSAREQGSPDDVERERLHLVRRVDRASRDEVVLPPVEAFLGGLDHDPGEVLEVVRVERRLGHPAVALPAFPLAGQQALAQQELQDVVGVWTPVVAVVGLQHLLDPVGVGDEHDVPVPPSRRDREVDDVAPPVDRCGQGAQRVPTERLDPGQPVAAGRARRQVRRRPQQAHEPPPAGWSRGETRSEARSSRATSSSTSESRPCGTSSVS